MEKQRTWQCEGGLHSGELEEGSIIEQCYGANHGPDEPIVIPKEMCPGCTPPDSLTRKD